MKEVRLIVKPKEWPNVDNEGVLKCVGGVGKSSTTN